MALLISNKVRQKLQTQSHNVTEQEIIECFANRTGLECLDLRAHHQTNPVTRWFVSETDYGRKLKICYMLHPNGLVEIKTAYAATQEIIRIYTKYAS